MKLYCCNNLLCHQPHFVLVDSKAEAAKLINRVFSQLYLAPLWIASPKARNIAGLWEGYLVLQQKLAVQAASENKLLFLCNSKSHYIAHIVKTMLWECDIAQYVLNPLSLGVQMEEDTVGRVCRLVRRVSPKTAIRRSFQRYLVSVHAAWTAESMLCPVDD